MGETTNISWTDHTFNPWIGCLRVSPACDGCYAAHMMETRFHRVEWGGPGIGIGTRERTSKANWRKPIAWDKKAAAEGKRPFVFCSSLADVFDNAVPEEWRKDLFELIRATPTLVWLLLTKRPQNIVKMVDAAGGLPGNVALGTTVEDRTRADANLPALKVAKIELQPLFTFGSFEPLLELVVPSQKFMPDWVIAGGETDQGEHKARPSHPDWFRALRDAAIDAGAIFHFKQFGQWVEACQDMRNPDGSHIEVDPGTDIAASLWNEATDCLLTPDGQRYTPESLSGDTAARLLTRMTTEQAGRILDGVIHDERPEVSQ